MKIVNIVDRRNSKLQTRENYFFSVNWSTCMYDENYKLKCNLLNFLFVLFE